MDSKAMPYIDNSGNIVIPFNADPKYQYWNGGQKLAETMQEMKTLEDVWRKYLKVPYPGTEDSA